MAVDTRNKRMSITSISIPWRGMLPLADGTVDAADRQIFPYHYSGVLWSAPVVVAYSGVVGGGTGLVLCSWDER